MNSFRSSEGVRSTDFDSIPTPLQFFDFGVLVLLYATCGTLLIATSALGRQILKNIGILSKF